MSGEADFNPRRRKCPGCWSREPLIASALSAKDLRKQHLLPLACPRCGRHVRSEWHRLEPLRAGVKYARLSLRLMKADVRRAEKRLARARAALAKAGGAALTRKEGQDG